MTISEALKWGVKNLTDSSSRLVGTTKNTEKRKGYLKSTFNTAFLDAEILLSFVLGKPKEFLFTYPEKKLTSAQIAKYKKFIARRRKREPIAYITGKKEFYSRNFFVSPAVLIPRPDTETLIDVAKKTIGSLASNSLKIVDVGVGSGAIAITLKKEFPRTRVLAIEISPKAIALTQKNAHALGAKITIKKGDLLYIKKPSLDILSLAEKSVKNSKNKLSGVGNPIVITANLPYLSQEEWTKAQPEVKRHEPKGALVGGKTGTEIYKKLFEQIRDIKINNITLIIEIGAKQKPAIEKLAQKILKPKKIEFTKDLSGKWRVMKCST
ncbi:peptide chain release factor N(5)-glutamine methyltransferase [Candidatus Parcubacteria bacterium]|nr:peptide chain release factor N(5)-glutamine methyltransferase [Patescibacteria group bacterium]MCG2694336.1 peptide chain release factor N(5)-glutamine methyltransferase [Candidatus Parcubacteria bacterium]